MSAGASYPRRRHNFVSTGPDRRYRSPLSHVIGGCPRFWCARAAGKSPLCPDFRPVIVGTCCASIRRTVIKKLGRKRAKRTDRKESSRWPFWTLLFDPLVKFETRTEKWRNETTNMFSCTRTIQRQLFTGWMLKNDCSYRHSSQESTVWIIALSFSASPFTCDAARG